MFTTAFTIKGTYNTNYKLRSQPVIQVLDDRNQVIAYMNINAKNGKFSGTYVKDLENKIITFRPFITSDLTLEDAQAVSVVFSSKFKENFAVKPDEEEIPDDGVKINGIVWATRNVDAPGTFAATPESVGMFYQWNRKIGWSSTDPMVNSNGGTTWDNSMPSGTTWESANDPCPTGWRVPTHNEQVSLLNSGSIWTTQNGINGRVFGSGENTIFLPITSWRNESDGSLYLLLFFGEYWSSSYVYTSDGLIMHINSDVASWDADDRRKGFSIRCVKE
jgi:uncharacterized protein (TIGR02145 family)